MGTCLQQKLDFANRGLKTSQFIYTAEICKNILNLKPDCIEAREILQSVSKSIYENKSLLGKIASQVMSFFYLLSAFIGCKCNKLNMFQQALHYFPKGKIPLIFLAQIALDEGYLEILLFAYQELHLLFPKDLSIGLALGEAFISMEKYNNALELGREILEKDPANLEAMNLVEQAILAQMHVNLS